MHGYEIRKQLSELLGLNTAISYGSLYPSLAKLHRQGLIHTSTEPLAEKKNKTAPPIFSTGSLSGDVATSRPSILRSSRLNSSRKNKKVYSITEKGEAYFYEKLKTSFAKNANDQKAFVVHLAFLEYVDQQDRDTFIVERIAALKQNLDAIVPSDNHELKLWHDVEREYIENQIKFLQSLQTDL